MACQSKTAFAQATSPDTNDSGRSLMISAAVCAIHEWLAVLLLQWQVGGGHSYPLPLVIAASCSQVVKPGLLTCVNIALSYILM